MRDVSAAQASRMLGISLDTLRRWDREGKIEVVHARDHALGVFNSDHPSVGPHAN